MFRRAVTVLEGVKADSLFSYQPPINIFVLCFLLPASYILSPRWFHKVNVFLIRLTNFPILLLIAWYERQRKRSNSHGFYDTVSAAADKLYDNLPRSLKRMSLFDRLAGSTSDIEIIFEVGDNPVAARDTGHYSETPLAQATLQRRISRKSNHRASKSSLRTAPLPVERNGIAVPSSTNHVPQVAASPPRASGHTRQSSGPAQLRVNVNSHLHRPDVLQSPLAQIFMPAVTDDDIPEDTSDRGSLHPSDCHVLSYGPASRRRLGSMQHTARRTTDSSSQTPALQRAPFLSIDSEPETQGEGLLSMSPSRQPVPSPTAEEIEENMEESGGMTELVHRMKDMEERQQRIEDLLIQLSTRLRS